MKYVVSLSLLVVAFLLNPLWGCGTIDDEPDFQFDERDMQEYGEGSWEGELEYDSGERTEFELVLERRDTQTTGQELRIDSVRTREQPTCNETRRDFLASAEACASTQTSTMAFQGKLTTDDGEYEEEALEGELKVDGLELDNGFFGLTTTDDFELSAICNEEWKCGADEPNRFGHEPNIVHMEKR